jgi:hypothetical protein
MINFLRTVIGGFTESDGLRKCSGSEIFLSKVGDAIIYMSFPMNSGAAAEFKVEKKVYSTTQIIVLLCPSHFTSM